MEINEKQCMVDAMFLKIGICVLQINSLSAEIWIIHGFHDTKKL